MSKELEPKPAKEAEPTPTKETESKSAKKAKPKSTKEAEPKNSKLSAAHLKEMFESVGDAEDLEEFTARLMAAILLATSPAFWAAVGMKNAIPMMKEGIKNAYEKYLKNHPENKDKLSAIVASLTPPTTKDYYKILGVDKNASTSEIKNAFFKKALELHPDKNPDDPEAAQKFQDAKEAYETLKDPDKRANYDKNYNPSPDQSDNSSSVINNLNSTVEDNQAKTLQIDYQIEGDNDQQEQQYDFNNGEELLKAVEVSEGDNNEDLTDSKDASDLASQNPSITESDPLAPPLEAKSSIEPEKEDGDVSEKGLSKTDSTGLDSGTSLNMTPQ